MGGGTGPGSSRRISYRAHKRFGKLKGLKICLSKMHDVTSYPPSSVILDGHVPSIPDNTLPGTMIFKRAQ